MRRFISGGMLADQRTYIMSGVGIMSAVAAYLVGDSDVFAMLQAIFTLGGIYVLRKSTEKKGCKYGKDSGKISKQGRNVKR